MSNLHEAITISIQKGKPLTAAYLNQNFTNDEIIQIEGDCMGQICILNIAILTGTTKQIGYTPFQATVVKEILTTNLEAIRITRKANNNITETKINLLDNKTIIFDINDN